MSASCISRSRAERTFCADGEDVLGVYSSSYFLFSAGRAALRRGWFLFNRYRLSSRLSSVCPTLSSAVKTLLIARAIIAVPKSIAAVYM
jgi:hypothetical protein